MSQKTPQNTDHDIELNNAENSGQIGQASRDLVQIGRDYTQYIYKYSRSGNWRAVVIALIPLFLFLLGVKAGADKVVETLGAKLPKAAPTSTPTPSFEDAIRAIRQIRDRAFDPVAKAFPDGVRELEKPTPPTPQKLTASCVVTITHPNVALKSEPRTFSRDLIRVKPRDYAVLNHRVTTFFGLSEEGWFLIEAEGRTGWIEDDISTINSKTRNCP